MQIAGSKTRLWSSLVGVLFVASLVCSVAVFAQLAPTEDPTIVSELLISEIKLGGVGVTADEPREFVSIVNISDQEINLTGFYLDYAKDTFTATNCGEPDWSIFTGGSRKILIETLLIGEMLSIPMQLNDGKTGAVRLIESAGDSVIVHDLVGWADTGENVPCSEAQPAAKPANTKSLQRFTACEESSPIDTNNNYADFAVSALPKYGQLFINPAPECSPEDPDLPPTDPPEVPAGCSGIEFSELLPNPAGADGGFEFIELHNPTNETIELTGCSLQTSASTRVFPLAGAILPSEFVVLSDAESGLILPNSAGGSVWLLFGEAEMTSVAYPGELEDDQGYASFSWGWQTSFALTPGVGNVLVELKPCPEGEERNPETNRCRAITANETLSSCPAGQERNPLTNRCRLVSVLGALAACPVGQYRNPATNRCRSTSVVAGLAACPAGQERNPNTRRCRKVATLAAARTGLSEVEDVAVATAEGEFNWLLIGTAVGGASGYGVYEWRNEIMRRFMRGASRSGN